MYAESIQLATLHWIWSPLQMYQLYVHQWQKDKQNNEGKHHVFYGDID